MLVPGVEAGAKIPELPRGVPADRGLEQFPFALDHVGTAVMVAAHDPLQLVLLGKGLLAVGGVEELAHVEAAVPRGHPVADAGAGELDLVVAP
jgi:hypothetical protein